MLRPLLAATDPEKAHRRTISLLKTVSNSRPLCASFSRLYQHRVPKLPVKLFARQLNNPVGLAAGFDKDGVAYPALAGLGFGFIELGTVTPKAQPGNPPVRIFRLPQHESIINRLGFNSGGLDQFVQHLSRYPASTRPALLGVNIGKNTATPIDRAIEDYSLCLERVYALADYVVLNLSSPNSPGLRLLQQAAELRVLLESILCKRNAISEEHGGRVVPIAVKVSPDLIDQDIVQVAEIALEYQVDALLATNTTIARETDVFDRHYREQGGVSGKLLRDRATATIAKIADVTAGNVPIIGVGGISSGADAWQKLLAGASAVQLYTALAYQGPIIVRKIVSELSQLARPYDRDNFSAALEFARQQESASKP